MLLRRSLILATCLLATACADSKFPYAPQFVSTDDVSVAALPTPPAADSKKFKNELDQIVALQKKLTQKEKNTIAEEGPVVPEMIVLPVLGKNYSEAKYPALYTLLRHAGSDSWRISDAAKEKLKTWTQAGGLVIGFESAVNWFTTSGLAKFETKKEEESNGRLTLKVVPKLFGRVEICDVRICFCLFSGAPAGRPGRRRHARAAHWRGRRRARPGHHARGDPVLPF
jgi:hypothetical protein